MRNYKYILIAFLILTGVSVNSQILQVGTTAPNFTLTADNGSTINLADYRGKNVVLYFYPQDMTSNCKLEAMYFNNNIDRFSDANTVILGVSTDDVASHAKFKSSENLTFPLLADVYGDISKTYGVYNPATGRANRVTYIINPNGQIVKVYEDVDVMTNYSEILDYLGAPPSTAMENVYQSAPSFTTSTSTTVTTTTTTGKTIVYVPSHTVSKKVNSAPYFAVTPYGGALFPVDRGLRDTFKPGWSAGIDLLYRINREVGIWAGGSYNQMTKQTAQDVGHYFEGSIGPRYFFTHPKLRAQLFVDAGVGVYNLNQDADLENSTDPNDYTLKQIDGSKVGVSGGIGATIALSSSLNLLGKARYNTVFGTNENVGFLNGGLGLEFRFR